MKYATYKNNQALIKHIQEHLDWALLNSLHCVLRAFRWGISLPHPIQGQPRRL